MKMKQEMQFVLNLCNGFMNTNGSQMLQFLKEKYILKRSTDNPKGLLVPQNLSAVQAKMDS